jgi:hypothetical protein
MIRRLPHRIPTLITGLSLLLLPGCSGGSDDARDMVAVADLTTLMSTVIEPAAETYWDAVGWILDAEGETYIRPRSPEAWASVRNAAFAIAESGNLLMVRDRGGADDAAWRGYSRALTEVGIKAIEAADAQDPQAVFDVGAEVYFVCTSCHARYSPEILRPNQTTEPAQSPDTAPTTDGTER